MAESSYVIAMIVAAGLLKALNDDQKAGGLAFTVEKSELDPQAHLHFNGEGKSNYGVVVPTVSRYHHSTEPAFPLRIWSTLIRKRYFDDGQFMRYITK